VDDRPLTLHFGSPSTFKEGEGGLLDVADDELGPALGVRPVKGGEDLAMLEL
jgi:hypothetical protein